MLLRRLRYWLRRDAREASLRAEMEAHLDEYAAALIADGMSEPEARAQAHRRFGNFAANQETSREVWIARYWWDLLQDLRYAARTLRAQPGFAAVAILSAALGIGACSTVFGIVNFAMLRPLPVEEPHRLMSITGIYRKEGIAGHSLSYPEIQDIRRTVKNWQGVSAFFPFLPVGISSGGEPQRFWGFLVSANYFDVVRPGFVLGRGFVDGEDDGPGAPAKVVLTHALWQSRFGADPALLGRTIQMNKRPVTVVGVTKPGFRGTEVALAADFFLPFSQVAAIDMLKNNPRRMTSYNSQWLFAVGRPKEGVEPTQAQSELDAIARGVIERVPDLARDRGLFSERAGQLFAPLRRFATPAFLLLLTVTFLVLLIACANVANLMLARASARGKEIATRLAMGATRGRLVRQLLAESILLALAGGIFGVVLAEWAGNSIGRFRLPMPVPIDLTVTTDYRVVLFCAGLSIITGIVFGLVPALRSTRATLFASLKGDAGNIASLRRFGLRNALVVTQVAISAVLLVCSGLFLRSLGASAGADTGLDTRNVLLVRFDPVLSNYDNEQALRLMMDLIREAESMPGVVSAGVTSLLPLSIGGSTTSVRAEDRPADDQRQRTNSMAVSPGYFSSMGIRLIAGSDFPRTKYAGRTAIVSEELARKLYPGRNALGLRLLQGDQTVRIVGIAANSKYLNLQEPKAQPTLYRPLLDERGSEGEITGLTLVVKTRQNPLSLAGLLRQKLRALDPELITGDISTMEAHFTESMFLPRLAASMFGLCGGIGLLIASIGVYGVISFAVARRTREIGIRMALGARGSEVVAMVLRHGIAVTTVGVAIGIAGGLALARAAGALFYGVSPTDPVTFLVVPLVLLAVALAAAAIPARRAALVDPNRTLRTEA